MTLTNLPSIPEEKLPSFKQVTADSRNAATGSYIASGIGFSFFALWASFAWFSLDLPWTAVFLSPFMAATVFSAWKGYRRYRKFKKKLKDPKTAEEYAYALYYELHKEETPLSALSHESEIIRRTAEDNLERHFLDKTTAPGLNANLQEMRDLGFQGTLLEAAEIANRDMLFERWMRSEGHAPQEDVVEMSDSPMQTFEKGEKLAKGLLEMCPPPLQKEISRALTQAGDEFRNLWGNYVKAAEAKDDTTAALINVSLTSRANDLSKLNRELAEIALSANDKRLGNAELEAESLRKGFEAVREITEPLSR